MHMETDSASDKRMSYVVGDIQGWRRNMEDAHIALLDMSSIVERELGRKLEEKLSLFGVFDGHGGKEVAKFVQIKFARELARSKAFAEKDFKEALRTTFHRIDDMLEDEKYNNVLNRLKQLPNPSDMRTDDSADDSTDDDFGAQDLSTNKKPPYRKFDPTSSEYDSENDDTDENDASGGKVGTDLIKSLVDGPVVRKSNSAPKKKLTKAEAIELFTQLILKETKKGGHADSQDDSGIPANDADEEIGSESFERISKSEWLSYYKSPTHVPGDGPRPTLQHGPASISGPGGLQCNLRDHRIQAGCTSVVVLRVGNTLWTANAGDSRAVLCRGNGDVHALSEDHKPTDAVEMARIEEAGGFVNVNGRINGNLNLSRSLGDMKYKQVKSLLPSEQMITAEPDFTITEIQPTDKFFVLACDGVWDVLSNQEMCDFVCERMFPTNEPLKFKTAAASAAFANGMCERMSTEEIVRDIFDYCVADDPKKTQGIGGDNMTAMIVELNSNTN